jgi:hypothetical protein
MVALLPGTSSASPPIRSVTIAANKFALACAPVQEGTPILTFSAYTAKNDAKLIATPKVTLKIVLFIIIYSFAY